MSNRDYWKSPRARMPRVSAALVALFLLAPVDYSPAAPITFAFSGTVTEIDKSYNAMFDLPFTVAVGDALSGLLTLEPGAFGDKGIAPSLEFSLSGFNFRATGVPVTTYNNVFVGNGSYTKGPLDEISIGCSDAPTGCSMLTSSALGASLSDLGLGMGSGDVASNGDPIAQSEFLNRFGDRTAALVFGSFFNGGSITVYGTFGLMQAVPEPASGALALVGAAFVAVLSRARLHRRSAKRLVRVW